MDFLDPRKKSARRSKLIVSYVLMALLIVGAATVLLASSFGYGYNTETGEIVQNGLVFIDSAPAKAQIFLNGKDTHRATSAHALFPGAVRMVLPTGNYSVDLKAAGYRPWSTDFKLNSQMVLRLDYALLLPIKISSEPLDTYKTPPAFLSQTPDQKWILTALANAKGAISFRQYNAANPTSAPASLPLPAGIARLGGSDYQPVEWSDNSSSLLVMHRQGASVEFIVFNRDNPADSFNLTTRAQIKPDKVLMRDGKSDFFYLYQAGGGKLYSFDVGNSKLTHMASSVAAFSPHQGSQVLFVTPSASSPSALVQLWDGSKAYTLSTLKKAAEYHLAAASYQGNDYLAAGSNIEPVKIFKNPLPLLKSSPAPLKELAELAISGTSQLKLSKATHFLAAEAGGHLAVYDFATQSGFAYDLKQPISSPASWLDEYHLGGLSTSGKALVWDYSGANQQLLSSSLLPQGAYFSTSYKTMFTLTPGAAGTRVLAITDLQL